MAPVKQVKAEVKVLLPAGKATPAPPVGTALGPHGIATMDFCKQFNEQTSKMDGLIPAVVTIYADRTFTFILKTPPASELIKKAAGISTGSGNQKKQLVGKITKAQLLEIARAKMADLSAHDEETGMKIIAGTARQMGVQVTD